MTEVFSTNVTTKAMASMLRRNLIKMFPGYEVNFDLQDCDHILRVKSSGEVDALSVIDFVNNLGYHAEVLADEVPNHTDAAPLQIVG